MATQFDSSTAAGRIGYVDAFFQFSQLLGVDYSGEWQDSSTFVITVLDSGTVGLSFEERAYYRPSLGVSNATVRGTAGVTSSNYTAKVCNMTALREEGLIRTCERRPL